jgi:hypothetical protein
MMDDMHRPTPTDAMTNTVMQIEAQIVEDEAQEE